MREAERGRARRLGSVTHRGFMGQEKRAALFCEKGINRSLIIPSLEEVTAAMHLFLFSCLFALHEEGLLQVMLYGLYI